MVPSFYDRVANGAYHNDLPNVTKRQFEMHYWYRSGKCVAMRTAVSDKIEILDLRVGDSTELGIELGACTHGVETDMVAYQEAKRLHTKRTHDLRAKFREDLLEHLGLKHGPQAEQLLKIVFEKADGGWGDGGLMGVVELAEQLAPLIHLGQQRT